jgi:adhesin transport system outer membrane protein
MNADGQITYTETGETVELNQALINTVSLERETSLGSLAANLDAVAITRSPAVQDLRAAQARLQAKRYDWFPILKPTASVPISNAGDPSIGLSLEQVVWDGGRIRSGVSIAEYQVVNAALTAWNDRNDTVHDGLSAFVEMSRYTSRIRVFDKLQQDLNTLNELLQTRQSGGVADRGELLRMNVALQEVQRETLADEAEFRKAETELARLLPDQHPPRAIELTDSALNSCRRSWPDRELPANAIARFELSQREAQEAETRARLWPRVIASAATSYVTGGTVKPSVALQLDSEDLLGLGRQGNIAAAEANTQSARNALNLQRDETRVALARLEADYKSTLLDIQQMTALEESSKESLALYDEQLDAGTIPITEGITLHREAAETRLALADLRAEVLNNCLRIAQLRGTLAPFSVGNE